MRLTCIFFTVLLIVDEAPAAFGGQHAVALPPSLDLTLAKSISLAIQNNRGLMNSRLDRALQKFALKVAEDEFRPKQPSSHQCGSTHRGSGRRCRSHLRVDLTRSDWRTVRRVMARHHRAHPVEDRFHAAVAAGGWVAVNTASLKTARLREEVNILALRAAVSSTVTRSSRSTGT